MDAQDKLIAGSILAFCAMLFSAIGVWVNVAQEHSEDMRQENLQACVELDNEDVAECVLLEIEG